MAAAEQQHSCRFSGRPANQQLQRCPWKRGRRPRKLQQGQSTAQLRPQVRQQLLVPLLLRLELQHKRLQH
jgi:hypothetical protein